MNTVLAARSVLLAWHGNADAESNQWCIQHEGAHAKAPLQPILVAFPLELLHMDFISIEMALELDQLPHKVNALVLCDHFTRHDMVYVTPNQTAKNCC